MLNMNPNNREYTGSPISLRKHHDGIFLKCPHVPDIFINANSKTLRRCNAHLSGLLMKLCVWAEKSQVSCTSHKCKSDVLGETDMKACW